MDPRPLLGPGVDEVVTPAPLLLGAAHVPALVEANSEENVVGAEEVDLESKNEDPDDPTAVEDTTEPATEPASEPQQSPEPVKQIGRVHRELDVAEDNGSEGSESTDDESEHDNGSNVEVLSEEQEAEDLLEWEDEGLIPVLFPDRPQVLPKVVDVEDVPNPVEVVPKAVDIQSLPAPEPPVASQDMLTRPDNT